MMKLDEQWAEILTLFFLVLGFVISVLIQHSFLSYIIIFLTGFLAGRIYYLKHQKEPVLPFVLMILGFLIGYVVASFWVNRIIVLVLFVLAFGVSYYLHLKKILTIFKSEDFIR